LIKHISKCLVENKHEEAKKALEISKKFFSEGSPLRNELKLFQSVLGSKNISKEALTKIVEYACKSAGLMNSRILNEEKSKLIKEINYNLSKNVYDHKVPEYVNYSSLQVLFDESRNRNKKVDEFAKIKLKDGLVTRLLENKVESKSDTKLNPSINNTVYKILVKKFNEKYAGKLTEGQKKFLMQYTISLLTDNKKQFHDILLSESKRIVEAFNVKDPKVVQDTELMKKINECSDKYRKEVLQSKDEQKIVLGTMQYMSLVDELLSE
jgi:hypothetical protein